MNPDDEERAHAAALAGLPAMTPVRLAKLLDGFHPVLALKAVQAGAHPADPDRRFARAAGTTDVDEVWASYCRCGVRVLLPSEAGYPTMLLGDPGAPAVLFRAANPPWRRVPPGWPLSVPGRRHLTADKWPPS